MNIGVKENPELSGRVTILHTVNYYINKVFLIFLCSRSFFLELLFDYLVLIPSKSQLSELSLQFQSKVYTPCDSTPFNDHGYLSQLILNVEDPLS